MKNIALLILLGSILGSAAGGYGGFLIGEFMTWRKAIAFNVAYYDPATGSRKWGTITVVKVDEALKNKK